MACVVMPVRNESESSLGRDKGRVEVGNLDHRGSIRVRQV